MLGKEIPELMKMLVKEKREEGLELKGMSNRELPKDSYVSFKDDDGYVSFMFIFIRLGPSKTTGLSNNLLMYSH